MEKKESEFFVKPNFIIGERPEGFQNITQQLLNEKGFAIEYILGTITSYMMMADFIICHNAAFDMKVIYAEMVRQGAADGVGGFRNVICDLSKM